MSNDGRDSDSFKHTCGVRFLSTSQLLVLLELSVLQVVPSAKETQLSTKNTKS